MIHVMLVFPHGTATIKTVLKYMQKNIKISLKVKKKHSINCCSKNYMLLYFSENWIFLSANMVSYDYVFKRCHV